jgi:hypothetical protein
MKVKLNNDEIKALEFRIWDKIFRKAKLKFNWETLFCDENIEKMIVATNQMLRGNDGTNK